MPRDTRIELDWADGEYVFRLGWKDLVLLQEACDAGPLVILGRLSDGTWRVDDISQVIRCGLIGGGLEPKDAMRLVKSYVLDRPPMENLFTAQAVLSAGCVGAPDEPLGNPEAAAQGTASTGSRTESSELPPSTAPGP